MLGNVVVLNQQKPFFGDSLQSQQRFFRNQPSGIGASECLSAIFENDSFLQQCSQKYLLSTSSLVEGPSNPKLSKATRH
ncbi:hypothetical protein PRUPE_1G084000 [Prunus persica]|uniref:Uncharacterized protein n=1 Tax=Prunus persica TaxID=3760 RepID=A0A251QUG8_PRUPE|nr:hypothetical protein PRUPE_1G084000 [Prunus persica]